MRRSFTILRGLLAPVMLLAWVVVAQAEEGGSSAEQTLGNSFKWIHFVIIAIAAYWLFKKKLPPYFRHNADKITADITKATAAKAEAERLLKEAATKLTSLEREVAQFRDQAQKDSAAELERLRGMGKLDIEKVGVAANAEIEAAERAARWSIRRKDGRSRRRPWRTSISATSTRR